MDNQEDLMQHAMSPRQELMAEILDIWADAAAPVLAGKLGMATEELLQEADRLLRQGSFEEAEPICAYVSNLVTSDWEAWPRIKMDYVLAEAAAAFYLGTVSMARGDVQAGLERYRTSIDRLSARKAWLLSAAIWYASARIQSDNCSWEQALSAFQYALNTLEMARPRPPQGDALEAEIRVKFDDAKEHWIAELKAGRSVFPSPEPTPPEAQGKPLQARAEAATSASPSEPAVETPEHAPRPAPPRRFGDLVEIPIVRDLAAGAPRVSGEPISTTVLQGDDVLDVICLDENHARGIDFGFRVRGKSMVDAGILDGDFVLVKRPSGATPEDGQTVAVAIHGLGQDSTTLKKFYNRGDHFELRPMNSTEPHIIVIPGGANREPIEDWYNEHEIPALFLVSNEVEVALLAGVWRRV